MQCSIEHVKIGFDIFGLDNVNGPVKIVSKYIKLLSDKFNMAARRQIRLEDARDTVRHQIMDVSHVSIKNIVEKKQRKVLSELCGQCKENKVIVTQFHTNPYIFVVALTSSNVHINRSLIFNIGDSSKKFKLKSMMYFEGFHFTYIPNF